MESPSKRKGSHDYSVIGDGVVPLASLLLYTSAKKKAVFYVAMVFLLSIFAHYYPFDQNSYFANKRNIFNQFGPKLGWLWTTCLVGPFITLTAYLHHNSVVGTAKHLTRLVIATGVWYFVTNSFVHLENHTGRCVGAISALRHECHSAGGNWETGVDISGHTFLLVYNILIMTEEALALQNWPNSPRRSSIAKIPTYNECLRFDKLTIVVQILFIAMACVHLFWDAELVITCFYFHDPNHKLLGALFAVIAWFLTYGVWFPKCFPGLPIHRKEKIF